MKKILIILLSCVPFLYGCTHNESIQEKFNILKDLDYSEFKGIDILNRKGVYLINYHGSEYSIKRNFFTKNISSIERDSSKEKDVLLTKKDTDYIENTLKSFDKIGVIVLSVDEKGNVFLSIPWYDMCTYNFLRLSPTNSLKDIKMQNYQNYEDNWYMDKECSER